MKKIYTLFHTMLATSLLRYTCNILLLFLFLTSTAFAQEEDTHMLPISLEERVQQASLIVEGEVISKKSFWDVNKQNIYTSNVLKVYKVFKGNLQEQRLEVITDGGSVGLDIHVVSSTLNLNNGQQGIFFLNNQAMITNTPAQGVQSTMPYGSQQGLISYNILRNSATDPFNRYSSIETVYSSIANHTRTKYRVISQNTKLQQALTTQTQKQDAQFAPVITSFTPLKTSAGTKTILTINGSGFGNTRGNGSVEFKNADDGGQTLTKPFPREYISWSDTQIRLLIPGQGQDQGTPGSGTIKVTANDGTAVNSAVPIIIEFVHSNVVLSNLSVTKNKTFAPTLINKDKTGGYTIQFAPSMQNNVPAQYGFQRAVTSWVCATGINWKIGEPVSQEVTADDDRNIIRFAPASVVGDRVLARTISRYAGFKCGPDTLFFLDEFDMEINSAISWQYGPGPPVNRQFDFETVMLHELGHAHQLGHIILPLGAVMHYSVASEITYRDLSPADIEGGRFIMARSVVTNACGEAPIIPIPASQCNIFANIINQEATYLPSRTVEVKWTSTDETGVLYYEVQRSGNGVDYTTIGRVDKTGNNSKYVFTDTNPLPLRSFYRIRAVYANDVSRFSTRMAVTDPEARNKVFVVPNPVGATGKTNIVFLTNSSVPFKWKVYDISGKLIKNGNFTYTDAVSKLEIDLSKMATGMYILEWSTQTASGTEKILKL
jgi:hypothetical protein